MKSSVYIHFPWCARKCPYCDFATTAREPSTLPHQDYADAIRREIALRKASLQGHELVSIFFGGGTPSLWDAQQIQRVRSAIEAAFTARVPELEITAECNPASFDERKAESLLKAGVTRFSLGVQSLRDQQLRYLGRLHDVQGAKKAIRAALASGARVSTDLIFGMPQQKPDELREDLASIVDMGVRHISAYALTIEANTVFGTLHKKGKLKVASENDYAAMFELCEDFLQARGFEHYEVSNYALPGEESRHNQHYWRGGSYLGLGAAAVGCLVDQKGASRRYRNQVDASHYMQASSIAELEQEVEPLEAMTQVREALLLGLRTSEGLNRKALQSKTGLDVLSVRSNAIKRQAALGNLVIEENALRVPKERWIHLDSIVEALF